MKYYSDYTQQYVQDICDAINADIKEVNQKPLSPESFETLTYFLQHYVVMPYGIFTFLDSRGLVNRGRCPYTGQYIDSSSPKWTYMGSRSVYVSRKGHRIMKKEDDEDFKRVMGHPPPKKQSDGCYIATVCYGNEFSPEVLALKKYRDTILSKQWYGRLFIHAYYLLSPWIAKKLKNKSALNSFIRRIILDRIVQKLD